MVRTMDALPLLAEAKLAPPRLRPELLSRPRVAAALDAGGGAALTLVSAPPGYGKTTAVRAWCAGTRAALAWVTLDARDNDPVLFWTYVATAVDRVREGLGRGALRRLGSADPNVQSAVEDLANGIAAFGEPFVLVLDDVQTVTGPECTATLDLLLERLPPNARLVLITRVDPALRLA